MNLTELLTVFNFRVLQECATLLKRLEHENVSVEDFHRFMADSRKAIEENKLDPKKCRSDAVMTHVPKCPACAEILALRESPEGLYESEWFCKCGYRYYSEVSVMDQRMGVEARMRGSKPDFEPEEIRASPEERKRRRAICETCDQLTSNKTCKACGCRMKHRTYYEILTCPKKFW